MYANGYGGNQVSYSLNTAISGWTQVTIPNINVTNGQCKFGFYSKAGANQYVMMDDAVFSKN